MIKRVYILPNLITAASMMFGMLAIFHAIQNEFTVACYFILISGVMDFLDGKVARMIRATSDFGVQFDSLSDLSAFGVAPAILMFQVLTGPLALPERLASGVCVPYAICGALRLARFNVQAAKEESKIFTGMPIPAAAGSLVALYFVSQWFSLALMQKLAPIAILGYAYLMVSRIQYPSLKQVAMSRRKSFDMLVAFVLTAGLLYILREYFQMAIVFIAVCYTASGLLWSLWKFSSNRPSKPSSVPPAEKPLE